MMMMMMIINDSSSSFLYRILRVPVARHWAFSKARTPALVSLSLDAPAERISNAGHGAIFRIGFLRRPLITERISDDCRRWRPNGRRRRYENQTDGEPGKVNTQKKWKRKKRDQLAGVKASLTDHRWFSNLDRASAGQHFLGATGRRRKTDSCWIASTTAHYAS